MSRRESAFTLIELIVTLSVLAIVTTIAVPALGGFVRDNRMTTVINHLSGSLHYARRVAVTRAVTTVVCPGAPTSGCRADGRWEQGWLVFTDPGNRHQCVDTDGDGQCNGGAGKLLRVAPELTDSPLTLRATGNPGDRVAYKASGFADGYAGTFSLCDKRDRGDPRGLTLSFNGRVRQADEASLKCGGP